MMRALPVAAALLLALPCRGMEPAGTREARVLADEARDRLAAERVLLSRRLIGERPVLGNGASAQSGDGVERATRIAAAEERVLARSRELRKADRRLAALLRGQADEIVTGARDSGATPSAAERAVKLLREADRLDPIEDRFPAPDARIGRAIADILGEAGKSSAIEEAWSVIVEYHERLVRLRGESLAERAKVSRRRAFLLDSVRSGEEGSPAAEYVRELAAFSELLAERIAEYRAALAALPQTPFAP